MFSPTLVHEYLRKTSRQFPEKVALASGEERMTYRVLDRRSDVLADGLIRSGVRRHDRAVIFLDSYIESVVSLFGILKAGGVFVMLNGSLKSKKLAYILKDSGATTLITHAAKARVVREALDEVPGFRHTVWVGAGKSFPETSCAFNQGWEALCHDQDGSGGIPAAVATIRNIDQDLAALIYTSGSTGEPKGVISSHHNMVSAARSIIQYIGNTPDDIIVDVLPLSFDYGLYQVIMSMMFGGTIVFESFVFPVKVLQCIGRERVTGFPIVPTIAAFLLKLESLSQFDLSSLRYMTNTGAALPTEHIRRLRVLIPTVKLFSMFGLTESKRTLYLPPDEIDRRPGSVGKAIPNCEVFVVDENGKEVPAGETGELVIRGSNVMRGYWNAPELTAMTYRPGILPGETLLHSGDVFKRDEEGFLYFLGRKDDQIKTKGERVSPKEVENTLSEMKGVSEVAVIGIPDDMLGSAIKVFIVPAPGVSLTEKDVLKYCTNHMETFMVPKFVTFLAELPKTPNGKIDKKSLKALD
jgi:amino acid adenylation domain-containing protein